MRMTVTSKARFVGVCTYDPGFGKAETGRYPKGSLANQSSQTRELQLQ